VGDKAVSGGRLLQPLPSLSPFVPQGCRIAFRAARGGNETLPGPDNAGQVRGRVGREGGCWRRSSGDSCRILGIPVNIIVTPLEPLPGRSILELAPHDHASFFSVLVHTWKENTF
jgi:hypothetical protein